MDWLMEYIEIICRQLQEKSKKQEGFGRKKKTVISSSYKQTVIFLTVLSELKPYQETGKT
jgi:hypothetical protein